MNKQKIVRLLNTRITDIESALQVCENEKNKIPVENENQEKIKTWNTKSMLTDKTAIQEKINSLNAMLTEFKNVLRSRENKKRYETALATAMRVCTDEHKKFPADPITKRNMMLLGIMYMVK